jgi:hypothetical protein
MIQFSQGKRRAMIVSMVMILQVPENRGISSLAEGLLASEAGLCSIIVKLSLSLTNKHYSMKTYGGVDI